MWENATMECNSSNRFCNQHCRDKNEQSTTNCRLAKVRIKMCVFILTFFFCQPDWRPGLIPVKKSHCPVLVLIVPTMLRAVTMAVWPIAHMTPHPAIAWSQPVLTVQMLARLIKHIVCLSAFPSSSNTKERYYLFKLKKKINRGFFIAWT